MAATTTPKQGRANIKRMTIKSWLGKVGPSVPLAHVPEILDRSPRQVRILIHRGYLPLHTFRIPDGKTYHMVRRADLQAIKPILLRHQIREFMNKQAA
ncbi:hypothetical protein [Poriferisphaera sp. WC338]|uniref:hypothetical protein n=1 Tax=Poriferisphaera sp. WC338 TaxID=3425129 RepID=UPI003D81A205